MVLLSTAPVVHLSSSGGSGGGTMLVKDIVPGPAGSLPSSLVNAGGKLFFLGVSATIARNQLWVTDGTSDGTVDLTPGLEASTPLALGNSVVFTGFDVGKQTFGIYTSDGTVTGTHQVASLPKSSTSEGVSADGVVYFDILNFVSGNFELWKSDGTSAGTGVVSVIPSSANLTVAGSNVYFRASDFSPTGTGTELWVSNGTAAGTHVVADLNPGSDGSYPAHLTNVGGTLYFTAFESFGSPTLLWKTDGTAAGTTKVTSNLQPAVFANANGRVVFTATDADFMNPALWSTDGTPSGTALITNLPDGQLLSMAALGSKVFFGLRPDASNDFELWSSDGTAAGTQPIASFIDADQFTASGGRLYFSAETPDHGNELWVSDGTAAGTTPVADINPGFPNSNPTDLTDLAGVLYYSADDGAHGRELWQSSPASQEPDTSVNEGSSFTFGSSFTDPDGGPWTATVNYGDGSGTHALALNPDHTFTLDHQYADNGTFIITVAVTDSGGLTGVDSLTVSVVNVAPQPAILGIPLSSAEGTAVTLTAFVNDPSSVDTAAGFTTHWSVTRDGEVFAQGTGSSFTFTPNDNGTYLVTLSAQDKDGAVGTTSPQIFTVTNLAPVVSFLGVPAAGAEGTPIAFTAAVNDASPVDQAAGFSVTWTVTRNGAPYASGTGVAVSFTPDDDGSYKVTVSATDKDGDTGSASTTIAVVNVAPTVDIVRPLTLAADREGTAITLGSVVSDPSPVDTAAGFTTSWSVTRNGELVASGSGSTFSFVPTDNGDYLVSLTATDKDGGAGSATTTISVANVAPTASIVGAPASASEGTAVNLSSLISDPSSVDTAAGFTTSWTVTRNGGTVASGTGSTFSFAPEDNGDYVVTLTATDKDGGSSTATATISVANVVPTASLTGDSSGVRGQTRNFVVSAADPSSDDSAAGFTFQINWGDGSAVQTIAPGQSTAVGHVFKATGTYTVQVTATDKDGEVSPVTSQVVTIAAVQLQADPADPSKTALVVGGTTGSDTIRFKRESSTGWIKVLFNGSSLGSFAPTGHLIAFGQSGCDDISVADNVSLPSILHGGDGDDRLRGGGGDAILVGGRGRDDLEVNGGRNLLIGGSGADELHGGNGDNIMINGSTAYDDNDAALIAILAEWERNIPLVQRVNHLKLGIAGGIKLDSTTVFNDCAHDSVCDGDGHDWILADSSDCVHDDGCGSIISYLNRGGWDSPSGD